MLNWQMMSTRADLVGLEMADEFTKLQDDTLPFDFDTVKIIVEGELGKPLDQLFQSFEEEHLAAASLARFTVQFYPMAPWWRLRYRGRVFRIWWKKTWLSCITWLICSIRKFPVSKCSMFRRLWMNLKNPSIKRWTTVWKPGTPRISRPASRG